MEKKPATVVRLRPMPELMKESKRVPVVPGGSPKDFAPRHGAEDRAKRAQQIRENNKIGAWAFVSGMAWMAVVLIAIYHLTGV
tara:strand:+ start:52 stop:300 length:249 start_codon:yes stop_codon:yes gene_type:complete